MIKIKKDSRCVRVYFSRLQPSGRRTYNWIEAKVCDEQNDEPAFINAPATGDMQLDDIPEFIEAVRLAGLIASGKMEIDR